MIRISAVNLRDTITFVARQEAVVTQAAALAVSDVAEWGKNLSRRAMLADVNLPADALAGRKFRISQRPTQGNPEAVITADNNPLGLSRFVTGDKTPGRAHPTVRIKKGGSVRQFSTGDRPGGDYSFLIPTPNGAAGVGLALRTKTPMRNSSAARKIGRNLYLLSGPSVNQMFGQMLPALVPRIEAKLAGEFARQYERLSRG